MTAEVIYLDPSNAVTMNNIKSSISWMESRNKDGKYSEQIDREKHVLRDFFTLVRNTADQAANAA